MQLKKSPSGRGGGKGKIQRQLWDRLKTRSKNGKKFTKGSLAARDRKRKWRPCTNVKKRGHGASATRNQKKGKGIGERREGERAQK